MYIYEKGIREGGGGKWGSLQGRSRRKGRLVVLGIQERSLWMQIFFFFFFGGRVGERGIMKMRGKERSIVLVGYGEASMDAWGGILSE